MKKFWISIASLLAIWALLLIIVPMFNLFNVHILKYIMQSVVVAGMVIFGIALFYIMVRILFTILSNLRGQKYLNKEVLSATVLSIRPAQTIALRSWLFVVSFIGVGILASYIGKLIGFAP